VRQEGQSGRPFDKLSGFWERDFALPLLLFFISLLNQR
jgi:hypothetical protein